jgi:hypothetical protein
MAQFLRSHLHSMANAFSMKRNKKNQKKHSVTWWDDFAYLGLLNIYERLLRLTLVKQASGLRGPKQWQTLPLHPGVERSQDEVKDARRAPLTLQPTLGHREVREEQGGELCCRELDGNRPSCKRLDHCAHHAKALFEAR